MKFLWCICLLLFATATARALEIQQVRWGFDGQVTPGRFNVLSVLVANNSRAAFDGMLQVYKSRGLEYRVGAIYGAPCYLSPLTSRWIQFHVYVDNQYDEWRLEWGRRPDERHEMPVPKWARPAQVLLSEQETPISQTAGFKQFPEELFPSTVAATGGLGSVLLDHAPRWEAARREAFLNWLRTGGTVHVLKGADGRYPVFPDDLGVLNSFPDRIRIGAGLAVRHDATAREMAAEDLEEANVPRAETAPEQQATVSSLGDPFLRTLMTLSRARHNWAAIYLLAIAYVALAGPGTLLLGRRLRDYRLRIALLLGCVAGFTLIFQWVGRRGQGEASVVHTLSYARPIHGETYNVMQWINVFATEGAQYTITHAAPHNLYATAQDHELVKGLIQNGKDGRFLVDIPLFSHRALLHQAELKGAPIPATIINWDGAEQLSQLTLDLGPDFTKQIVEGWVVQGDRIYTMQRDDDRITFTNSTAQTIKAFIADASDPGFEMAYVTPYESEIADAETHFRRLVAPLIGWSLGITRESAQDPKWLPAIDGRTHLFLFTRSPESFSIAGEQFGREVGYVLYHLDLF